jgi:hypothetical protein
VLIARAKRVRGWPWAVTNACSHSRIQVALVFCRYRFGGVSARTEGWVAARHLTQCLLPGVLVAGVRGQDVGRPAGAGLSPVAFQCYGRARFQPSPPYAGAVRVSLTLWNVKMIGPGMPEMTVPP